MRNLRQIIFGAIILVVFLFFAISGKYLDWLWFKSLGSTSVFWVTFLTGPLVKLIFGIVVFGFFLLNFLFALRSFDRIKMVDSFWANVSKSTIFLPGLIASAVLSFFLAAGLTLDWSVIQQFIHQVSINSVDPIFKKDIGFYLFKFPFFHQLNSLLQIITFLALAGIGFVYFLAKAFWQQGRSWELWKPAKIHIIILTILFLLTKIWGYTLGKYGLLYRETARLTGISYTSEHAQLLGLTVLSVLVAGIIVLLLINMISRGIKLLLGSLILWIASSFILTALYPNAIQSFIVAPNEYELEAPYLKNHIELTRKAYDLEQIRIQAFNPQEEDKQVSLNPNNQSLTDLRLWDYKPLLNSYNQLQSIRPYYQFNDIDLDRYQSAKGQKQVMITARELKPEKLAEQAKTWINLHLTYTHGYGMAANQVTEFSSQGQPIFIAKDLPPKSEPDFPSLKLNHPEIYFGEATNHYIIVNTRTPEFDYPLGDQNMFANYEGPKGISLNSLFRKLLMAICFKEPNFVLSSQLTSESSLLMHRNVMTRIQKLGPFLKYDDDPYLVASAGKLFWIIDAYTTSSYYPYTKRHQSGINYIRNSVKVIVDAYSGEVNYYIIDQSDPIIKVWQKVFPDLFKPLDTLSSDLISHFRYPEYLLSVQRDILAQYHMTNPKTFYAQEDYWEVPTHNQGEIFEPYYVTLKLPQEKNTEFVLMQPFSPRGKQNLISWLIARCDHPNYGELTLYILPKDKNIYGPAQIDSRINQDQVISQLLTLWNQQQSRVVWGSLLLVPIDDTLLYIKPLFIESQQGQQAELKKVVMVYQNQVLLGDTIAEALSGISFKNSADNQAAIPANIESSKLDSQRKAAIIKRLEEIISEQQRLLQELRSL